MVTSGNRLYAYLILGSFQKNGKTTALKSDRLFFLHASDHFRKPITPAEDDISWDENKIPYSGMQIMPSVSGTKSISNKVMSSA